MDKIMKMTDEEKFCNKRCRCNPCKHICEYAQVYLDGLAEGRKELEQWKQEWQDAQIKANEEGFARTTIQIKYKELEKENEKLKEQIEKMKCCGNCFNSLYGNRGENGRCENCGNKDEWELAK